MTLFPAFLDLRGLRVLVVGGGAVGLRKTLELQAAGAVVRLVSPTCLADFDALPKTFLERIPQNFAPNDLEGVVLVFACTSSAAVNDGIAAAALERGIFCNHASQPSQGNMRSGAVFRGDSVLASFSSGSELPYLSQALRDGFAQSLPQDLTAKVQGWTAQRRQILALDAAERAVPLELLKTEISHTLGVK
jgi:precorrin-2 dehydrogenase / sirohydrochlorin ferrochelatase